MNNFSHIIQNLLVSFLLKLKRLSSFSIFFCSRITNNTNNTNTMFHLPIFHKDPLILFSNKTNGIFIPKKHTVKTYAQVRREAKIRRQKRKYNK